MRPTTTLFTLIMVLAPLPASAQDPAAPMRDQEAMDYQLSMEKLRTLVVVQRDLNALDASDPKLFDGIDREHAEMAKKSGRLTVAQRAAVLDRRPQIRRVLSSRGTSSRDWMLTSLAMGYAWLALEIKMGRLDPRAVSPPTTAAQKANLVLLEQNQAEWGKIRMEIERLVEQIEE